MILDHYYKSSMAALAAGAALLAAPVQAQQGPGVSATTIVIGQ